jgi:hypothetical protein
VASTPRRWASDWARFPAETLTKTMTAMTTYGTTLLTSTIAEVPSRQVRIALLSYWTSR